LPIYKTEHVEGLIKPLCHREWNKLNKSRERYGKSYDGLSVGQRYELLYRDSAEREEKHLSDLKDLDNALFVKVLYEIFPPSEAITPTKVTGPPSTVRMLFFPNNEMSVVALFSMCHRELGTSTF